MNPFAELSRLMSGPDPSDALQLAEGAVISDEPLAVEAFGILWKAGEFAGNAQLLAGAEREVRFEPEGGAAASGKLTAAGPALKAGDRVLCLTDGGKNLYVICKVVR